MKALIISAFTLLFISNCFSQTFSRDSLLKRLINEQTTPDADQGIQLIQNGNYAAANQFLSSEITKDESDRQAYFKRGVANWALSDTLSACRDWSAVLALGDTEMFNLLDSHCHGAMIIEDDTLQKKQYHKLFGKNGTDEAAIKGSAKTVVEVMPTFPGGDQKLFEYLTQNIKKPADKSHGTVFVNFLINKKGKVLFPYVTHGVNAACDKEAIRLVRNMPAWNPGKDKGKVVYVRSNLPVRF